MKTVLVTGANKGIGHEVARQLAAKEFHVFVGARNAKAGRKAAEGMAKQTGKATFLEIDVSDNESVTNAARTGVTRPTNRYKRKKIGRVPMSRDTPLSSRSPGNFLAIAQEFAGQVLRCFAGEPYNRVRPFLH